MIVRTQHDSVTIPKTIEKNMPNRVTTNNGKMSALGAAHSLDSSYRLLFDRNPQPMWVFDLESLAFLAVNQAALEQYGYSRDEFLRMTIKDIRPTEDISALVEDILHRGSGIEKAGRWRHRRKDGANIDVEITSQSIEWAGRPARLVLANDITNLKRAEEKFERAFNANPEPMTIARLSDGRYIDLNDSFLRITGYQREEVISRTSLEIKIWKGQEDRDKFLEILRNQGSVRDHETTFLTKSGEWRTGMISAEIIEMDGQDCVIAIVKDSTDQKALEKQLRQSQKMEAVGQLSGGIAHDFNNLLSVIIGYSELIEGSLPPNDPARKMSEQVKKAGESAASLTRQLLAFSRQQVLELRILDLNAVVRNVEKMLRRLIGEDIDFSTALEQALANVKADQGQIEQVLINLAVNARDAMPRGGKLRIETALVDLDEEYARRHPPQRAGAYVLLTVSDTGIGMDAETQAHIFDPFFTTKEIGKGTGLGLSTVYGIVRQSGGHIWVYSEIGQGTTFKIYLPLTGQPLRSEKSRPSQAETLRGTETILLVEDAEALRELARGLLTDNGYTVLEAERPEHAIEIARKYAGSIDLLLSDMVMPGMNGRLLAEKLASIRPEMTVLFMSGYTGFTHSGLIDSDMILLPKPFTKESLLRKVHEVLALKGELKEK